MTRLRHRMGLLLHYLALFYSAILVYVIILGGFRFQLGDLVVSATRLRNPLFFTLLFAALGKMVDPATALRNSPLGRISRWLGDQWKRIRHFRDKRGAFWISVLLLNALLFVPLLVAKSGTVIPTPPAQRVRGLYDIIVFLVIRDNPDFFRICVDLYFMITVLILVNTTLWYRPVTRIFTVWYSALLSYQIYAALSLKIFGQEPLIYSDLLLLKDGLYLMADTWSWELFDSVVRALFWGALVVFLIHNGFLSLAAHLRKVRLKPAIVIPGTVLWIVIALVAFRFHVTDPRPVTRIITANMAANIWESTGGMQQLLNDSPPVTLHQFASVELETKPNIYLFMVESYGKIVADDPELGHGYSELMGDIRGRLSEAGWYSVTNYSEAPIKGGRSWLSMMTILGGIHLDNEALYRLLMRRKPDYHHLVRVMGNQGYETLVLQPTMRPRAGYSFDTYESFYDYDRWIYYDSLHYEGEEYGWGMVPDQYSLNYAHDRYLTEDRHPFFFTFITVTSHAPWYDLPPYADDWTTLNNPDFGYGGYAPFAGLNDPRPRTWRGVARHVKKTLNFRDLFEPKDYMNHMAYQLRVINDYLIEWAPENSIALIIGDHQPPVLTGGTDDFGTPVHIVSKDQEFLNSFASYGFVPGTYKEPNLAGTVKHEGIFSMVLKVLIERYGRNHSEPQVEYLPNGIPLSILRK